MNRARVLNGLVVVGVVTAVAAGFAGGQPPPATKASKEAKPAAPPTVEAAITAALRNNPDVRVAEAEVQVAQAKLAQAKLAVAQKVSAAHAAADRARADVKAAEANYERDTQLVKKGFAPQTTLDISRLRLDAAKAAVATAEADYNALLGVVPGQPQAVVTWVELTADRRIPFETTLDLQKMVEVRIPDPAKPVTGGVADKLREALDKPVRIGPGTFGITNLVEHLKQQAGLDVLFRVVPADAQAIPNQNLEGGTNTVGGWIQMIEDENPGLRFVIREYGVLVTTAKTLPPGAVTVQEFWKQVRAEKATPKK